MEEIIKQHYASFLFFFSIFGYIQNSIRIHVSSIPLGSSWNSATGSLFDFDLQPLDDSFVGRFAFRRFFPANLSGADAHGAAMYSACSTCIWAMLGSDMCTCPGCIWGQDGRAPKAPRGVRGAEPPASFASIFLSTVSHMLAVCFFFK